MQQHTIQQTISFEGIGLHTGKKIKGALMPLPPHSGIQFQRTDLCGAPTIEALVTHVVATERGTVLEKNQLRISTVEHLLAALAGLQIDNICIQLDGPEVPDLDGSAKAFVALLLQAGLCPQAANRSSIRLTKYFRYDDPDTNSYFEYYPSDTYSLHCTLAYNKWPLENQYATLTDLSHFKKEIAPARTFIYLDEIIKCYEKGLLQGGNPNNALILSADDAHLSLAAQVAERSGKEISMFILSKHSGADRLRYLNEPARHKLLDLMGDLMLLGHPLQGKIFAHNPGHGPNTRFAAALSKLLYQQKTKKAPFCDLNAPPLLDVKQVSSLLPHRYPFQLVDKIMHADDSNVIGIKNVTINEPFFQGHFPNNPIMPGVLQIEALAQTGGLLVLRNVADPANYLTYFLSIDACKFRYPVFPGDTLLLHCELLTPIKFNVNGTQSVARAQLKGRIFVGERLVSEAILLAQIVKHEK